MDDAWVVDADKPSGIDQALSLFPDIDPDHLAQVAREQSSNSEAIIAAILDKQEQGQPYPRRTGPLKRKRSSVDGGEGREGYDEDSDDSGTEDPNRDVRANIDDPLYLHEISSASTYKNMAMALIGQDFPFVPKRTINPTLLYENGNSLYKTYLAIDELNRSGDSVKPKWTPKKTRTKILDKYRPSQIQDLDRRWLKPAECKALDEFIAARRVKAEKDAEQLNLEHAREKGETEECGCCFDEFPLNRMVHCEGTTLHVSDLTGIFLLLLVYLQGCDSHQTAAKV